MKDFIDDSVIKGLGELQTKFNVPLGQTNKIVSKVSVKIPLPQLSPEMKEAIKDIKELSKNPEKLQIVLTHIYDLEHVSPSCYEVWRTKLIESLGWKELPLKSISRALTELQKRDFIVEWRSHRNHKLGFMLGTTGLNFLGLVSEPIQEPVPVVIPTNVAELIQTHANTFLNLAELGEKIRENRAKFNGYSEKMELLDLEFKELMGQINPDLQKIVLSVQ